MKIIFIHGYGSSCDSDKKKKLEEFGYEVSCITVDHKSPSITNSKLDKLIRSELKEDPIIVGHSLGSLWAYYFAGKYGLKCCLMNPSFSPSKMIRSNFSKESLDYLESIREKAFDFSPIECIVLGELGDEVLDHNSTFEIMKSRSKVQLLNGGDHRFKSFSNLQSAVKELSESLVEF